MNFIPQEIIKTVHTKQLEEMLTNVSIIKEIIEAELELRTKEAK